MNGDISRIPIQSFGAVFSLTDILPELPLPSAFPHGSSSDSLLADPEISNDVMRCLCSKDENLIGSITEALSKVSTDNIDLDDDNATEPVENPTLPPVLVYVLQRDASVFRSKSNSCMRIKSNSFNFSRDIQQNLNDSDIRNHAFDEESASPGKRKHKKKRRRKRRLEYVNQEASSGGESNAATPGGSVSDDHSNDADDSTAPTPYGVSVDVKPDEKKILLKFSLKRPTTSEANASLDSLSRDRKEKKHKKSKDRGRKRHHSRDKGFSLVDSVSRVEPLLPSANGVPMTAKPVLVSSPSATKEPFSLKSSVSTPHSPHPAVDRIGSPDANPPFDLQGVFDQVKPDFAVFHENFLKGLPQSVMAHSNSPNHPPNSSALNYTDFLAADLLSVTNLSPPIAHPPAVQGSGDSSVYRGSFMIASHLEYDTKLPGNFLEHISDLQNASLDISTHTKPPEPSFSQAIPLGLASYLNSSKPQSSTSMPAPVAKVAPAKPAARRRAPVSKRRRCNEVEGLRTWTVKYPGQRNSDRNSDESSAWDAAVDRQANYLRNKRRRMTRQPTALAADYVLENDKDYPKPLPRRSSAEDMVATVEVGSIEDSTLDAEDPIAVSLRSSRMGLGGVSGAGASRCSYVGMDGDTEDVPDEECYKDGGSVRRRRRPDDDDAPFEVRIKEPAEQRFPHLQKVAAEHSRPVRERVHHKLLNSYSDVVGSSDAASASSLQKFLSHIDHVLEAVEEVDLLASGDSAGDDGVLAEAIISPSIIAELCRDAAKLKSTHAANQVPTDRLLKLLTLLLLNIRDGASVIRVVGDQEGMEKISRSVGASLIALNLMTSKDMPREIYLEDVIEQAVQVTRFQLSNCIYPEYDPAYRIENSAKDNQSSIRSRRARERDTHKSPTVVHLYYRLLEIVTGLAELVSIQRLTDSLVLSLYSVGVSIFFVENVSELQLAGLKLVTGVFAQYPFCRKLIIEEIITGIARLPSSKRNLRTYRLNSEESIQMFTALALLLVQSVIELPTSSASSQQRVSDGVSAEDKLDSGGNATGQNAPVVHRPDDEVLVTSSYKKAIITAHNFLSAFLRKSTTKGEDDYRIIFENFVNDLLLTVNKPEWPAAEVMLSLLGSLLVQQFNNKSLDQSIRVTSVDYLGTVASTLRRDAVTSQLKEHDINVILRELTEGSQSESEEDDEEGGGGDADKKSVNEVCSSSTNSFLTTDVRKAGEGSEDVKDMKEEKRSKMKKCLEVNLSKMDKILVLRDAVLDYLLEDESDPVVVYACKFYMGQWLEDCTTEVERAHKAAAENPSQESTHQKLGVRRGKRSKIDDTEDEKEAAALSDVELAELRRAYLMDRLRDPPSFWRARCRPKVAGMMPPTSTSASIVSKQSQALRVMFKGSIDYEDAYLICRYLASLRPFSQSFDIYLSQICKLLSESSVPVRTKALRCLSAVVEADPGVLARSDIEIAVRSRLMDISTSVREAAVDLLGRFLICRPELTAQYYPMLSERIRDKGVSVRKRVIRILRDICVEQPDFPRIAEICVRIIRRVNDEESVKKLVSEVFQALWFTPVREKESVKLLHKVMNITDVVVSASKDTGIEWLEQFLEGLLTKEEGEKVRPAEKACVQIVECLVQNIMRLDEIPGQTKRLVACLATLHLFTKIRPYLTVKHAMLLQPYLSAHVPAPGAPTQPSSHLDSLILHYVARILEVTIPLIEHPSEAFLAQLEEDLVRLTLRQGKMVLESCVACLGAVVNRVSKNYSLAMECFRGFFNALVKIRRECLTSSDKASMPKLPRELRPSILRSLFTVGLLCKHFDINVFSTDAEPKTLNQVFEILMFFSERMVSDLEVRKNALSGLGFLCTRHKELLCGTPLCKFYHELLQAPTDHDVDKSADLELKSLVLENLLSFFMEEERRMLEQDARWKATHKEESLKVMGDVASGTGSYVAQSYLKEIMETFFSPSTSVRLTALSVVTTILRQGLIHPVQTVPYLIAMQTDSDASTRIKAEAQLQEIENKFPGFIYMRAIEGVCFSYRLQRVLHSASKISHVERKGCGVYDTSETNITTTSQSTSVKPSRRSSGCSTTDNGVSANEGNISDSVLASAYPFACPIRGARDVDSDVPSALNSQLYSMLRVNRTSRRAFLNGLINLFDELQNISLGRLVYVADNLAFFPYQCQAEPLFVIHHIDLLVSVNGSTRLQAVREALFPELKELLVSQASINNGLNNTNSWAVSGLEGNRLPFSKDCAGVVPNVVPDSQTVQQVVDQGTSINSTLTRLEAEEENEDALVSRILSADSTRLASICESIRASRACLLLLNLKQYLKEVYGITDRYNDYFGSQLLCSKIQKFSPSDSGKLWEKQLTRKSGVRFFPALCLRSATEELRSDACGTLFAPTKSAMHSGITHHAARDLVLEFFEFRKLILSIDPPDEDGFDATANSAANADGLGGDDRQAIMTMDDIPLRLGPDRSLVPQSHNRSSDEEDDSADSDAGGASRLLLAQSAPQRRRAVVGAAGGSGGVGSGLGRNSRASRSSGGGGGTVSTPVLKRKSVRQPRVRSAYISNSESESEAETLSSEEESGYSRLEQPCILLYNSPLALSYPFPSTKISCKLLIFLPIPCKVTAVTTSVASTACV
ncbi:nipped b protein [Echinococcus multilocularis]|uniref:Nipped-B protein n=1 Tax=Echinococcus multilocularis TaxID=6211 RepID=A0A087VXD2_ECHMU|nr:nipped b protein [Echinococcus multilocularis]